MAKLTSITVNFGRTVQPAQYESKKSDVTLTAVPDDEDSFLTEADLNRVAAMAKNKALELVGIAGQSAADPTPSLPASIPNIASAPASPAASTPAPAAEAKRPRGRPPAQKPMDVTDLPASGPSAPAVVDVTALEQSPANPSSPSDDVGSTLEAALAAANAADAPEYTGPMLNKMIDAKVKELREKGIADASTQIIAVMMRLNKDPNAKQFAAICLSIAAAGNGQALVDKLNAL